MHCNPEAAALQERHRELISAHHTQITHAAGMAALFHIPKGAYGDVTWERSLSMSGEQHTSMIDFSIAGEHVPAVLRQHKSNFPDLYQKSPAVREHYPVLYAAVETTYRRAGPKIGLLIMERLEGYSAGHLDEHGQSFTEFIQQPGKFEDLVDDTFETFNSIFTDPADLSLQDIIPTRGHNIFYNTHRQHFMPFDVDTVQKSHPTKGFQQKFIDLLETQHRPQYPSQLTLKYIACVLKKYIEHYPQDNTRESAESFRIPERLHYAVQQGDPEAILDALTSRHSFVA